MFTAKGVLEGREPAIKHILSSMRLSSAAKIVLAISTEAFFGRSLLAFLHLGATNHTVLTVPVH